MPDPLITRARALRDQRRAASDLEAVAVLDEMIAEMERRDVDLHALCDRIRNARLRHGRECCVNPGGPLMAALGDPEPRACTCGLDALRVAGLTRRPT